jgi:hypothetical protein
MPRFALPCLLLLSLTGCVQTTGFPRFIAETHSFSTAPNLPPGEALNMQRVQAMNAPFTPIAVEPGTIWPGPPAPMKSMIDLQNEQNNGSLPPSRATPDVGSPNYRGAGS